MEGIADLGESTGGQGRCEVLVDWIAGRRDIEDLRDRASESGLNNRKPSRLKVRFD